MPRGLRQALMGLLLAALCAVLIAPATEGFAQGSPFGVPGAPPAAAPVESGGWFDALGQRFLAVQQRLHRQLGDSIETLKTERAAAGMLVLIALSFGYGIVHAAGPGHGKAVISSYVLANEETVRRGIVLSFVSAIAQALTAVALVGLLAILFNSSGARITGWANTLETASYALIAGLGLYLLVRELLALFRRGSALQHDDRHAHGHHAGHDHDHNCGCGHLHAPPADALKQPVTLKSMAAVVAAVGIRPCTGAILVLIFALAQDLFWAGVAATFVMALGTAITVSALAALAVGSRDFALRYAGAGSGWASTIWTACSLGGAAAIFLLGAVLFAASLGPARPF